MLVNSGVYLGFCSHGSKEADSRFCSKSDLTTTTWTRSREPLMKGSAGHVVLRGRARPVACVKSCCFFGVQNWTEILTCFFLWFLVCQECLWRSDLWKLNLQGRNYSCWMWEKHERSAARMESTKSASTNFRIMFTSSLWWGYAKKRRALDVRRRYRRFCLETWDCRKGVLVIQGPSVRTLL